MIAGLAHTGGRQAGLCRCAVLAALVASFGTGSSLGQELQQAESLSASFRKAARKVLPLVVTVRPIPAKPKETSSPGESRTSESKNGPLTEAQGGSGFVIDADRGYILTNDHVVRGAAKVMVVLHGGREREAKAVRRDPKSDLALVLIDPKGLDTSAVWGDSEALDLGDWVLAIGQPFGLSDTVTAGIVSGKGRGIGIALYEDLIQTDAAINPGNSGGPLINLKGEVVGINTAIKTSSGSYEGVGFAVPSSRARRVAGDLAEFGRVRRAFLGLSVRRVEPSVGERLDQPGAVVVTEVTAEGPAADAGIRVGDLLLEIGAVRIDGPGSLQASIEVAAVGKPLEVLLERNGKRTRVKTLPRSQPERFGLPEP